MERPYHHGNLRSALIAEGVRLARAGGPAAVTIRDLARATGVSPSAAYRHFPDVDHILAEISRTARQELATAMIDACRAVPGTGDAARDALSEFAAMGEAYIRYGIAESNMFDTAFVPCEAQPDEPESPSAWEVLCRALDDLVEVGLLSAERRVDAPLIAWATVHGMASILSRRAIPDTSSDEQATWAAVSAVQRALELPGE
jgi:AcrR family transcriptional regulator